MKKYIASSVAAAALLIGTGVHADEMTDLQRELQAMKEQLKNQQAQIDSLKSQAGQEFVTRAEAQSLIQSEVDAIVDTRVESGLAQLRDTAAVLTLGENINALDIRGDLTLRWARIENDWEAFGDESDDFYAARVRVGGVWRAEGWEVGIGLGTLFHGDSTDRYDVFNEDSVFETNEIYLDYAYAKHTWGDLSLTVGQHAVPFRGTWILWDRAELRPVGVTLEWEHQDFFVVGGAYHARRFGESETDGYLFGLQAGYNGHVGDVDFTAALAYYHGNNKLTENEVPFPDDDYQFQLADVYVAAHTHFGEVGFGVYGEYVHNFGAEGNFFQSQDFLSFEDPDDQDDAFIIGADVTFRNWTLGYAYAHIESDAVPASLNDDEFGSPLQRFGSPNSVNAKGHVFELHYAVNENITIKGAVFLVEEIEEGIFDGEGERYQVDIAYTF